MRGDDREDSPVPFQGRAFDKRDQPGSACVAGDGLEGFAFGGVVVSFSYERTTQPRPKIGPWRSELDELLSKNAPLPKRERATLKRIFEDLQVSGYQGGYDAVWRCGLEEGLPTRVGVGRLRSFGLRSGRGVPVRLEPRGSGHRVPPAPLRPHPKRPRRPRPRSKKTPPERGHFCTPIGGHYWMLIDIELHSGKEAKPFNWTASPERIIAARQRGTQMLGIDH